MLFGLCLWACPAQAGEPVVVKRPFVSDTHGLVVRFPPGLTYCPVAADWVGSDHGTVVYLVRPAACDAAAMVPRIEI